MVWTKEKVYLSTLFAALIVAIVVTLYFNRKDTVCSDESYKAHNKKIFILYTGGTIGMVETPDGYAPKHGFLEQKLRDMTKDMKNIAPYNIVEYSPLLDSANMTPRDWSRIGSDIAKVYDNYDAFIIIHGTDTMAYTASALAFMLENLDKPVIVTGSMISLQDERNDGRNNLLTSLSLATKYKIPEVVICFSNRVLRGCRTTKVSSNAIQGFGSPNYPPLGKAGVTIDLDEQLILDYPSDPFKFLPINPKKKVAVVKLFPGITDKYLDGVMKGGPFHGIILETFGIGDAPTDKKFIAKIAQFVKIGVIVVNVSQCSVNENETGTMLKKAGVVTGLDMTTEAALAKTYFLLSNLEDPTHEMIEKLMKFNIHGELVDKQSI